jgi:hypothetical protein
MGCGFVFIHLTAKIRFPQELRSAGEKLKNCGPMKKSGVADFAETLAQSA